MITSHRRRSRTLLKDGSLYGEVHEYYPEDGSCETVAYALEYYDGTLRFVQGSMCTSTESEGAMDQVLEFLNR